MAGRFSDDEEELKIPNMFFSEESILNKAKYVKQLLEYRIRIPTMRNISMHRPETST